MNFNIIHIKETDSTNRWITTHGGVLTPCVVVADYQTAGKGCGGNSWESEKGKNLTFSMMIQPEDIPANEQFRITEITSVALCEVLEKYLNQRVEIKWPNDIYVGDRKICGMLIENQLQGNRIKNCIIGIGLNVNQREFVSDAPNPVSVYQLTGKETDREQLLNVFLSAFDRVYNSKTTCFDYRERLFRRGKDSLYKDKTSCFEAVLTDVLPDGRLVLRDKSGRERLYAFKEIEYVIKR